MKTVAEAMIEEERKAERRERFAVAALQGLLASGLVQRDTDSDDVAIWAVDMADAMLRELDEVDIDLNDPPKP